MYVALVPLPIDRLKPASHELRTAFKEGLGSVLPGVRHYQLPVSGRQTIVNGRLLRISPLGT